MKKKFVFFFSFVFCFLFLNISHGATLVAPEVSEEEIPVNNEAGEEKASDNQQAKEQPKGLPEKKELSQDEAEKIKIKIKELSIQMADAIRFEDSATAKNRLAQIDEIREQYPALLKSETDTLEIQLRDAVRAGDMEIAKELQTKIREQRERKKEKEENK